MKRENKALHLFYVKAQQEGDHLQAKKKVLIKNEICQHLDLGLPSLQLWKINSCSFKIFSLRYSVNGSWSWLIQAKHSASQNWFICNSEQLLSNKSYMMPLIWWDKRACQNMENLEQRYYLEWGDQCYFTMNEAITLWMLNLLQVNERMNKCYIFTQIPLKEIRDY